MKIALLADTHLSDIQNTPQEESLDWALQQLEILKPDACVWLGDITAGGSADAAMRFLTKSNALACPSVTVPGNSDIRDAETAPILERLLSNYQKGLKLDGLRIVGVNTSHNLIDPNEQKRLSALDIKENVLLCTHQSAKYLNAASLEFLKNWISDIKSSGYQVIAWTHGHSHIYREGEFEGVPTFSLCALDIDKNNGDAHLVIMDINGDEKPIVEEIIYNREFDKKSLKDALGLCCYDIEKDMEFAITHKVPHVEWRIADTKYLPILEKWRSQGGKTLSIHLPGVDWQGQVVGKETLKQYADFAVLAKADTVTIHPPEVRNKIMLRTDAFEILADAVADALAPVAKAGIDILVENNHTDGDIVFDPLERIFGCSPAEMVNFRNALNERLGKNACHLRFDIGHARNNEPLNEPYPIGKWYGLIGSEIRGYHLHQIFFDKEKRTILNHCPILGLHNGFISFDGFLWAWSSNQICHAPIILQVLDSDEAHQSYLRLRALFE